MAQSLPDYERLQQALRHAQRAEVRYAVEHPELGPRWLLTRVEPAVLVSGQRTASMVTLDVTEPHRAQQLMVRQAERTRAMLDSVLGGIVTVGAEGIEWMNRSARRMLGGSLSDFIGQPISIVATADAQHPFRRISDLDELIEAQAETFECRLQACDGREFWVAGNGVATGRESTGRQLTCALLDIDRRCQAEARTARARASLQRVIEAAPLAITLYDAKTLSVLKINQHAAQSLGRPAGQLIGLAPHDIFPAALAAALQADMTQTLATREVTQREYRIEAGGMPRLWDARYLPLSSHGEPADQLLLVATDVTEQRAAQQAQFEAAMRQRDMLVREVHHRIKNNLQGVAGLMQQIAARKPEMAAVMAEVVDQVPGGVSGLGLVRALLPRRSAHLSLVQQGDRVMATIDLAPPVVEPVAEAGTASEKSECDKDANEGRRCKRREAPGFARRIEGHRHLHEMRDGCRRKAARARAVWRGGAIWKALRCTKARFWWSTMTGSCWPH